MVDSHALTTQKATGLVKATRTQIRADHVKGSKRVEKVHLGISPTSRDEKGMSLQGRRRRRGGEEWRG